MTPATDNDALIAAMLPTAAAMTCAVADRDEREVHQILGQLTTRQLRALVVVLAAHVDPDKPFRAHGPVNVVKLALYAVAVRYGLTEERVMGSRDTLALDARAVACYVGKLAGMSSTAIGGEVGRDHTTVLNAWARVGVHPRLRHLAKEIAAELGVPTRDSLDEDDEAVA